LCPPPCAVPPLPPAPAATPAIAMVLRTSRRFIIVAPCAIARLVAIGQLGVKVSKNRRNDKPSYSPLPEARAATVLRRGRSTGALLRPIGAGCSAADATAPLWSELHTM